MAMILERLGYSVCTANNAEQALGESKLFTPSSDHRRSEAQGKSGLELMHDRKEPHISTYLLQS